MKTHTRVQVRLDTHKQVTDFVKQLNSDGTVDKYVLEDFEGTHRVDARSYLGAIYASAEFGDYIYLVNTTEDGKYPSFINNFLCY